MIKYILISYCILLLSSCGILSIKTVNLNKEQRRNIKQVEEKYNTIVNVHYPYRRNSNQELYMGISIYDSLLGKNVCDFDSLELQKVTQTIVKEINKPNSFNNSLNSAYKYYYEKVAVHIYDRNNTNNCDFYFYFDYKSGKILPPPVWRRIDKE